MKKTKEVTLVLFFIFVFCFTAIAQTQYTADDYEKAKDCLNTYLQGVLLLDIEYFIIAAEPYIAREKALEIGYLNGIRSELFANELASFWLRHPATAVAPPGLVPNLKMFIAALMSRSRISPQYRHLW